jgi:hypothetical protein
MIDTSHDPSPASEPHPSSLAFAQLFKTLRSQLCLKQLALSSEVRCTAAAVSYWETGQRLPQRRSLLRILLAFGQCGAKQDELDRLEAAWQAAMAVRPVTGRRDDVDTPW